MRRLVPLALVAAAAATAALGVMPGSAPPPVAAEDQAPELFATADRCMACHNGLVTPRGEDVSIGIDWRASMMAQAARDPYWHASVRREITDHPRAQRAIEDECSRCHMPMANVHARARGGAGQIFAHLPARPTATGMDALALDGVSCTVCHQILPDGLGSEESFTGGFRIDTRRRGERPMFGPFEVDPGRARIMRSAVAYEPTEASHLGRSELCATCHTLYTHAYGPDGEVVGELPEQVPYLEWRHSAFRGERSCQSCHMPAVEQPTPVSSVLGEPREGLSRHSFRGANFFMLRMLSRHAAELGVTTSPSELSMAAARTLRHLEGASARLTLEELDVSEGRLRATVAIENLAGHKLPTAYPSRRVWVHLVVRDAAGAVIFESGRLEDDGSIAGNDNDRDASIFEPHYERVDSAEQVQIYEPILGTPRGQVTTGLLTATRYLKDNRLLPRGFDPATAEPDVAVRGAAARDLDFRGGGDRVAYSVAVGEAQGPFEVSAALWYQPIGFRWAHNLAPYDAAEPRRFLRMYRGMASASATALARARASVTPDRGRQQPEEPPQTAPTEVQGSPE